MNKTRLTILPILGVFAALFLGWSTISAQTKDKLAEHFREIAALPSGSVFRLTITEEDATKVFAEYLVEYENEVKNLTQQAIGIRLEFSDPNIDFAKNEITFSIRGGKSLLKVGASMRAEVVWRDNRLHVDVKSVDVPIISVDPATVNSYAHEPIENAIQRALQYYEVRSFSIEDGYASLEAMKK